MSEDASLITRWSALDRLHRRIDATVERRLHQRLGLGVSEFRALTALDSGEAEARTLQLRDLATQVGLSQSATSRLVIRLRDRGLITTSTPAHDHRGVELRLTTVAQKVLRVGTPVLTDAVCDAVRDLAEKDTDRALLRYLKEGPGHGGDAQR
ncbi:MarR family winged helix-turn-helix transcriptional regulator [Streptomyces sp. NPDC056353]|uniref:MarR family winged helix-turn-helix transcriptional regulator n=1 Tax=unclassified Streptomyces TaxID=2593676 RepID=UPI0035DC8E10